MAKKRVLVVEDEAILAELLKCQLQSLQSQGHEVFDIVDGDPQAAAQLAIEKMGEIMPQVIIVDGLMDGQTGHVHAYSVKEAADRCGIPVILYSSQQALLDDHVFVHRVMKGRTKILFPLIAAILAERGGG